MGKRPGKPVQFTLRQLLMLTLIVSAFMAAWRTTGSLALTSWVAIGIPMTVKLNRLTTHESRARLGVKLAVVFVGVFYWYLPVFLPFLLAAR